MKFLPEFILVTGTGLVGSLQSINKFPQFETILDEEDDVETSKQRSS